MASEMFVVDDSEEIARVIFEPSMVDGEDRISRNAFFLERLQSGDWESYLSVWRTLYRVPTWENTEKINARTPGDKRYGYGTLNVGVVHSSCENLEAKAKVWREKKNPKAHHVGIYYYLKGEPIKGFCDDLDFLELTMTLAAEAVLFKFPPIQGDVIS